MPCANTGARHMRAHLHSRHHLPSELTRQARHSGSSLLGDQRHGGRGHTRHQLQPVVVAEQQLACRRGWGFEGRRRGETRPQVGKGVERQPVCNLRLAPSLTPMKLLWRSTPANALTRHQLVQQASQAPHVRGGARALPPPPVVCTLLLVVAGAAHLGKRRKK